MKKKVKKKQSFTTATEILANKEAMGQANSPVQEMVTMSKRQLDVLHRNLHPKTIVREEISILYADGTTRVEIRNGQSNY